MTLAVSLGRTLIFPHSIQEGGGNPRKVHWTGGKEPVDLNQSQGGKQGGDSGKGDNRGYHSLSEVKIGDVSDAFEFFKAQLSASRLPTWIARGYFCMIHLARKNGHRPSAIFGRVKTCYPSDGYLQNIHEMELLYPKLGGKPLEINLHSDDINHSSDIPSQSYCVKVKCFVTPQDQAEFTGYENTFLQHGYETEFIPRHIDMLDVNEFNQAAFPRVIVVSSRWFASAREISQGQVYEKLHQLIKWNKTIINYHPSGAGCDTRTLNQELGFKYGFSNTVLIEPETPQQTLQIVAQSFDRNFLEGMG